MLSTSTLFQQSAVVPAPLCKSPDLLVLSHHDRPAGVQSTTIEAHGVYQTTLLRGHTGPLVTFLLKVSNNDDPNFNLY